jgi:hypothetical protein
VNLRYSKLGVMDFIIEKKIGEIGILKLKRYFFLSEKIAIFSKKNGGGV